MTKSPTLPKLPNTEDQRVIYDVMRDHFLDAVADGVEGANSPHWLDETTHFLTVFMEGGFAPAPVDILSRAALRDAVRLRAIGDLTPEDFA